MRPLSVGLRLYAALAFILGLAPAPRAGERDLVLAAMQARPGDPWPRSFGHSILAWPGSSEDEKGYMEPGGGFSPGFATFGVSIWVADGTGRLLATSETIPMASLRQKLLWEDGKQLPTFETETPFYSVKWSLNRPGQWQLLLQSHGTNSYPVLVVRSVGPSGAPLQGLMWDGKRLDINRRWTLTMSKSIKDVQIGPEGFLPGAQDPKKKKQLWISDRGWAYARLPLSGSQVWKGTLEEIQPPAKPILSFQTLQSGLKLELPDAAFGECLDAQVAHIMMGLVRNETRPGDPNNYPLNWLRDGAYIITGLVRAGQHEVARQLCQPFAERDFFGGFGSEADAPGLALWALGETARSVRDPKFDAWLWPHVQRKAELIESMLVATQSMHQPFAGPVVPAHKNRTDLDLVCDAARDGLIQGRMDWHRPVLFVNAVSYAGLREAAALARAMNQPAVADRWTKVAGNLREAWNRAASRPDLGNERNLICGLYPSWVVVDREAYRAQLLGAWQSVHEPGGGFKTTPLWTYFNFATAHQWLALGDVERVWQDLRWFWANQASPGLYTWWESDHEENSFGLWADRARGWAKAPNVTPHYWSAAEELLLQLDMLAMVDESGADPVLIIGAGMPTAWMGATMRAGDIGTRLGIVRWEWKPPVLKVTVRGKPVTVKAGTQFPAGTKVECSFEGK